MFIVLLVGCVKSKPIVDVSPDVINAQLNGDSLYSISKHGDITNINRGDAVTGYVNIKNESLSRQDIIVNIIDPVVDDGINLPAPIEWLRVSDFEITLLPKQTYLDQFQVITDSLPSINKHYSFWIVIKSKDDNFVNVTAASRWYITFN